MQMPVGAVVATDASVLVPELAADDRPAMRAADV